MMAGLIITIAQQKGGAGKTTVAAHLAVAFAMGRKSVAVLDVDPQGSLGQWYERREELYGEEDTGLVFRTASGWGAQREAKSLARSHDVVILDTPPKSDLELKPAIKAASLVVVPVQPTPMDLWATEPTLAMIDREGTPSLLVLNRVVARALLTAEVTDAVAKLGHPVANNTFGSRVGYAAAMGVGGTVLEMEPSSLAAQEAEAVAREVGRRARRES
jgi:chromosome partitioning protein